MIPVTVAQVTAQFLELDAILSTANNLSHAPDQKLGALIDNKTLIS